MKTRAFLLMVVLMWMAWPTWTLGVDTETLLVIEPGPGNPRNSEGDIVAVRITRSGTFKGKWGDIEPTGEHYAISAFYMLRIEDGMIAENWYLLDTVAIQKALGTYGKA